MLQPTPSDPNPFEPGQAREQRKPEAGPQPQVDPGLRAGAKLTEARRQLGLSLEEVSDRIRVRPEFLQAIEDMNLKLLPGKAYALAFLKSYARELGVNEAEIVAQFQSESALSREDAQKQIRNPKSKPRPHRPWIWAAAVVTLTAGFVGWRMLEHHEAASAAISHPHDVLAPTTAAASTGLPAPGDQRVVEIKALQDNAWLEARGPDGTVFLSRNLHLGDVYRPDSSPGWTLHARDGGAFEVYLNGQDVGPLGTVNLPVLGRPIDGIQAPVIQPTLVRAPLIQAHSQSQPQAAQPQAAQQQAAQRQAQSQSQSPAQSQAQPQTQSQPPHP
jgi:transcriptional regulator with XRE-family HTH domain